MQQIKYSSYSIFERQNEEISAGDNGSNSYSIGSWVNKIKASPDKPVAPDNKENNMDIDFQATSVTSNTKLEELEERKDMQRKSNDGKNPCIKLKRESNHWLTDKHKQTAKAILAIKHDGFTLRKAAYKFDLTVYMLRSRLHTRCEFHTKLTEELLRQNEEKSQTTKKVQLSSALKAIQNNETLTVSEAAKLYGVQRHDLACDLQQFLDSFYNGKDLGHIFVNNLLYSHFKNLSNYTDVVIQPMKDASNGATLVRYYDIELALCSMSQYGLSSVNAAKLYGVPICSINQAVKQKEDSKVGKIPFMEPSSRPNYDKEKFQKQLIEEQSIKKPPVKQQPTINRPIENRPTVKQPIETQPTVKQPIETRPTVKQPIEMKPTKIQPIGKQLVEKQLLEGSLNVSNNMKKHPSYEHMILCCIGQNQYKTKCSETFIHQFVIRHFNVLTCSCHLLSCTSNINLNLEKMVGEETLYKTESKGFEASYEFHWKQQEQLIKDGWCLDITMKSLKKENRQFEDYINKHNLSKKQLLLINTCNETLIKEIPSPSIKEQKTSEKARLQSQTDNKSNMKKANPISLEEQVMSPAITSTSLYSKHSSISSQSLSCTISGLSREIKSNQFSKQLSSEEEPLRSSSLTKWCPSQGNHLSVVNTIQSVSNKKQCSAKIKRFNFQDRHLITKLLNSVTKNKYTLRSSVCSHQKLPIKLKNQSPLQNKSSCVGTEKLYFKKLPNGSLYSINGQSNRSIDTKDNKITISNTNEPQILPDLPPLSTQSNLPEDPLENKSKDLLTLPMQPNLPVDVTMNLSTDLPPILTPPNLPEDPLENTSKDFTTLPIQSSLPEDATMNLTTYLPPTVTQPNLPEDETMNLSTDLPPILTQPNLPEDPLENTSKDLLTLPMQPNLPVDETMNLSTDLQPILTQPNLPEDPLENTSKDLLTFPMQLNLPVDETMNLSTDLQPILTQPSLPEDPLENTSKDFTTLPMQSSLPEVATMNYTTESVSDQIQNNNEKTEKEQIGTSTKLTIVKPKNWSNLPQTKLAKNLSEIALQVARLSKKIVQMTDVSVNVTQTTKLPDSVTQTTRLSENLAQMNGLSENVANIIRLSENIKHIRNLSGNMNLMTDLTKTITQFANTSSILISKTSSPNKTKTINCLENLKQNTELSETKAQINVPAENVIQSSFGNLTSDLSGNKNQITDLSEIDKSTLFGQRPCTTIQPIPPNQHQTSLRNFSVEQTGTKLSETVFPILSQRLIEQAPPPKQKNRKIMADNIRKTIQNFKQQILNGVSVFQQQRYKHVTRKQIFKYIFENCGVNKNAKSYLYISRAFMKLIAKNKLIELSKGIYTLPGQDRKTSVKRLTRKQKQTERLKALNKNYLHKKIIEKMKLFETTKVKENTQLSNKTKSLITSHISEKPVCCETKKKRKPLEGLNEENNDRIIVHRPNKTVDPLNGIIDSRVLQMMLLQQHDLIEIDILSPS